MEATRNSKGIGRASLTALIVLGLTLSAGSVAVAGDYNNLTNSQTASGWKQFCKDVDLAPMRTADLVNPMTRKQCRYFALLAKSQRVSDTQEASTKKEVSNQVASRGE
jgi:hypothetical protein